MKVNAKIWLAAIFLLILGLRLFVAFQTPYMDYEAYSTLRHVESIKETGVPLFSDELSYSGRKHVFSPVFHYILAGFSFIMPLNLMAKIIPNVFASLLVIVIFYISFFLVKKENIALIVAAASGLIPIFFVSTINNVSIYTLVLPLFFLTTYYFLLSVKEPKNLPKLLISMAFLTLLHPSSIILVFSMLIYVVLIKVQHFRKTFREIEIVLFFLFFVFWVNMVIYKNAFLAHGAGIVWQNIPSQILSSYFMDLTFIESILAIGIVPIFAGLAGLYLTLFIAKKKTMTLMMSIGLAIFILLWFKMINLATGLMFLGVILSVLSAFSIDRFYEQSQMAKFRHASLFILLGVVVIIVGSFVPNFFLVSGNNANTPQQNDIDAFLWLKNNSPQNSVVLTFPEEGSAMSFFSNRKNVIDDNYILIRNIDVRYDDATNVYRDLFLTTALERLNYYSINYIVLSEYAQQRYGLRGLAYEDTSCIERIYPEEEGANGTLIYKVRCVLRSTR